MEAKVHRLEQMPELVKPSAQYKESYLQALKELEAIDETGFLDFSARENFDSFLERLQGKEKGENLPEGYVPQTEMWLIDQGEFIGITKIRPKLNEKLMNIGGNIGYQIRPSKREMGYGTKILALALPIAKSLGVDKALLTCDDSKIASYKIIEKNGGILENIIEDERVKKRRYWIEIK